MKTKSNDAVLLRIRQGDESVIDELYKQHRTSFLNWLINKYDCQLEDAKEIFQVSIITLYDNVVNEKLTKLTSSLSTYLYSIGRNKMREWNRTQKPVQSLSSVLFFDHLASSDNIAELKSKELDYLKIEQSLVKLGDPCKFLLEQVYYYRASMNTLSQKLGYKNENTAKNAKYKCLQRLKKLVAELIDSKTKN